jgi:hypothetical protein
VAIISMAFSKASVATLIHRLGVDHGNVYPRLGFLISIFTWCLLSVFIVAFQCHIPRPWEYSSSNCPTQGKLYFLVGALNILTDALLSLYTILRIRNVSIGNSKRLAVIAVFASRLT